MIGAPAALSALIAAILIPCFFAPAAVAVSSPDTSAMAAEAEHAVASLQLADRLASLGDTRAAIAEYRRYLACGNAATSAVSVHERLAEAYASMGELEEARLAWRTVETLAGTAMDRDHARLRQGLAGLADGNFSSASLALLSLESTTQDTSLRMRARYLAGLSALRQAQWFEARTLFAGALPPGRDSYPNYRAQLDSVLSASVNRPMRSPQLASRLSAIIPGSGQIYAGSWVDGLNALLLNGFTTFLLVRSARSQEWDEVALNLTFLWGRYYSGNRYQASARAEEFNRKQDVDLAREATRLARLAVTDPAAH